jgi:hypothetical protein
MRPVRSPAALELSWLASPSAVEALVPVAEKSASPPRHRILGVMEGHGGPRLPTAQGPQQPQRLLLGMLGKQLFRYRFSPGVTKAMPGKIIDLCIPPDHTHYLVGCCNRERPCGIRDKQVRASARDTSDRRTTGEVSAETGLNLS